ncbi:MAG: Rrf2 family transcriptional regulator [Bacteroidales bacterium]|nr:MAG: Rrf2 family transcriptional regulator [Bacteroidales bacterium]
MNKIVNISEAASIAIHTIALIGKADTKLNATQISEILHSNKNHLAKVIQRLAKAGYIVSQRGPKGGFTLNRPKEEITLLQIYETIDGQIEPNICCMQNGVCSFNQCVFNNLPEKLSDEFRLYLKNTTIADIS